MSTAKKRGMGADKDFACIRGAIFNVIQQALADGVGVATLAVDQRDLALMDACGDQASAGLVAQLLAAADEDRFFLAFET